MTVILFGVGSTIEQISLKRLNNFSVFQVDLVVSKRTCSNHLISDISTGKSIRFGFEHKTHAQDVAHGFL